MRKITRRATAAWLARTNPERATHMSNGHLTILGVALIGYGAILIAFSPTMWAACHTIVSTLGQLPAAVLHALGA